MLDPRKPVAAADAQRGDEINQIVQEHLLAATELGAKAARIGGASFVMTGLGVWAAELTELDGRAAAKYLRALADIFDPRTNENQKRRAEKDRAQAARDLYAALDLVMAEAKGNG